MDLSAFSFQPEKLLYLAHMMYKDNLIDNKQKEQAKELIVNDDQQLYSWLKNYESSHKNLQFLQDQFIYLINLNLQEKQNKSEEKKNSKRVKIIDHNDSQDPCLSRNSSSSSPMSRAGWKRPSFAISKQRMGAKVTKMFTEENMSDLNTTKESSPEKNHKTSVTANHTPKSGLQRNQIVIPQLFIDEEDSSPLGKYLFEHKVVHQNIKPSVKSRIRPYLNHIIDDEFSSPQDTVLHQKKQRQQHH
ncbi:hypothetical protein ABPG74_010481 [Tetrahymena malaccensis]